MIKLCDYLIKQQDALLKAQNHSGNYKNYLNHVLEPAIKTGHWDQFEALDIGFSITGESLGKIGDNDAWRDLQKTFEPDATQPKTLDFLIDGKVVERNLTNQLKALTLSMIWLSPKDYSFDTIVKTITRLKKLSSILLNEGLNSFEYVSFEKLEAWVLSDVSNINFKQRHIYDSLNKLLIEASRLPFSVGLTKPLSPSDFGLTPKDAKQYKVIPQRLYFIGLQQSEALVNELYRFRDELGQLSDYIADYHKKAYQDYAKYLTSHEAKLKNGEGHWYLHSSRYYEKERNTAFKDAFFALSNPSQKSVLELLNKHKPTINSRNLKDFHPLGVVKVGNRVAAGFGEALSLFKYLNGGCLFALMSRTGMRSDEIYRLHTANGCTKESISGQTIYLIHADLSKTTRGSQAKQEEFVTTEVGQKAYEILQALHSPLRKRHAHSQSFFHKVKDDLGAVRKKNGIAKHVIHWFKRELGEKLALTNEDILDLKLSDPTLTFNVGEDYKFSPHQLRRSFAYYLIGLELCDFPQLKQQFGHMSLAMTHHYAKNASKFQKIRKQSLAHAIDEERIEQQAKVYLKIFKKLANKERVAGGLGKEFAKNMMKTKHNLFKDKVDDDMLSLNYWIKQIREQNRHIHAVAPGIYCTSTRCSLRALVNLLECVDCKHDYIVDAVFAEQKRKEAEIHMLWDIEHDELTPQSASEAYIKITAAERIMKDLGISYEPVEVPKKVRELLIDYQVSTV
ncbi:tyrosine-type recombinase/integrase [Enterovibrio norvegicus]|uniref:tyrosine-type recombinase/integrase n=1 Tax=Enterovibrio norvegicus TaxID=188144 RepID=UPI00352DB6CA